MISTEEQLVQWFRTFRRNN